MGGVDYSACDMADNKQYDGAGGTTPPMITTRVASICTMIHEHYTTETTMSAERVAAICAMIDEVADAAEGTTRWSRKRYMGSARWYEKMCKLGGGTPGTREYAIVMEYVGPTLTHVLYDRMYMCSHGRPFPEDEVRCIMRQLLAGAETLHKHRIIHRDIKPQNILVDGNVVKIGDYGSALSMDEQNPDAYWAAGTRDYSAPEMLLEKPDCDTLVDVWSLGCVMAELLAGRVLFHGDCDSDQMYKIFDVLGVPSERSWKAVKLSVFADKVQQWRAQQRQRRARGHSSNRLPELFPAELLSKDGLEVLKGLLTCNPYKAVVGGRRAATSMVC